jgi:D-alanyl-D-alanine carboxypeptidase
MPRGDRKDTVFDKFLELVDTISNTPVNSPASTQKPKSVVRSAAEAQVEKASPDIGSGRSFELAMVLRVSEQDDSRLAGNSFIFSPTGNKTVVIKALTKDVAKRFPINKNDNIIEQYPTFTGPLSTLGGVKPTVGSIVDVMYYDRNNPLGGGIILGFHRGGQKQQDDFTIFEPLKGCKEVLSQGMSTTHNAGESLPGKNAEVVSGKDADGVPLPNKSRTEAGSTVAEVAAGASDGVPATKKKIAEVDKAKKSTSSGEAAESIKCNTSYQLLDVTETENQTARNEDRTRQRDIPDDLARAYEISKATGISPRLLLAFIRVESKGNPRAVRFEPHAFLSKNKRRRPWARPDLEGEISYTPRNKKPPQSKDRAWYLSRKRNETNKSAFDKAFALDEEAAVKSTSFGSFQVMGEWLIKAYKTALAGVTAYNNDPVKVSDEMVTAWINANRRFKRAALKPEASLDFVLLARYYNGPGQKEYYGKLLKEAYDEIGPVPPNTDAPRRQRPAPEPEGPTVDRYNTRTARLIQEDAPAKNVKRYNNNLMSRPNNETKIVWEPVAQAFERMRTEAQKKGIHIILNSGQRSFEEQLDLRRRFVIDRSKRGDNRYLVSASSSKFRPKTAPPGKSNHQSGIAVDINTGSPMAGGNPSPVYKWLCENAHRFGFVRTVRSERWHWEYKGNKATRLRFAVVSKKHPSWDGVFT